MDYRLCEAIKSYVSFGVMSNVVPVQLLYGLVALA